MRRACLYVLLAGMVPLAQAQNIRNNPASNHGNKFEQLGTILPDANTYRTASGAPGHEYWQQKADYKIEAVLNENDFTLEGSEWVTYTNNSPDALTYIWMQLDENEHDPNAESLQFDGSKMSSSPLTPGALNSVDKRAALAGHGVQILEVSDAKGAALPYTINYTMMRIDLPKALTSGQKITFKVRWKYRIPERMKVGGRGGVECIGETGCLFTITQWYPRMCVYSDYQGWNHKQFTGRGEFALVFGNFDVKMTVPADHVIGATGTCQNYKSVLTPDQYKRWEQAQNSSEPIEIVTREEALAREKAPEKTATRTWHYKAENVRDFAWGSSRKFIWDAMGVDIDGKKVMAMSYYGNEAYGLYRKYSTKTVAHTLRVYSKFTIPYPYPVAISVEASNGMEYPMICFNFGRTEPDGTYSERTKYGMITVIIHEVGHNFFPMIINSDERQWSWMDEGLNTFLQFLTEQEFDNNYPSSRGPAHKIVDYMKMPKDELEPIMTNSENIIQFGNNAYGKPATALNILRETVMGRELFDHAFKEYARRWAFKHPTPADFFRTMEDASGVDLDWFWRGWFLDIEPVDISLDSVRAFKIEAAKMVPVKMDTFVSRAPRPDTFKHISMLRNKEAGMQFLVDTDTALRDFYYYYDPARDTTRTRVIENRNEGLDVLPAADFARYENMYLYELQFSNKGGTVMPLIIEWTYADGTKEIDRISAYIWRKNEHKVSKVFLKKAEVTGIRLDPYRETADIDEKNNSLPRMVQSSRIEMFKDRGRQARGQSTGGNPMQRARNGK
ncbi:MAG: M1 family metallopeptidase [Bacteroidia bacterium]|nr:M1 family metallopeptidase [Bacteroidia bacterium]